MTASEPILPPLTFDQRLTAIEHRLTAAPEAVSVKTLLERLRLGQEAETTLLRTLSPWQLINDTYYRNSMGGKCRYQIRLTLCGHLSVHFDGRENGGEMRDGFWRLGKGRKPAELLQWADILLRMTEFRLAETQEIG